MSKKKGQQLHGQNEAQTNNTMYARVIFCYNITYLNVVGFECTFFFCLDQDNEVRGLLPFGQDENVY